jgi:hypothetical protein
MEFGELAVVPMTCRRDKPASLPRIPEPLLFDFEVPDSLDGFITLVVGVNRTPQGPTLNLEFVGVAIVLKRYGDRCEEQTTSRRPPCRLSKSNRHGQSRLKTSSGNTRNLAREWRLEGRMRSCAKGKEWARARLEAGTENASMESNHHKMAFRVQAMRQKW